MFLLKTNTPLPDLSGWKELKHVEAEILSVLPSENIVSIRMIRSGVMFRWEIYVEKTSLFLLNDLKLKLTKNRPLMLEELLLKNSVL